MTTPQRNFITFNFYGMFGPYLYTITKDQARKFIGEVELATKAAIDAGKTPIERRNAKERVAKQFLATLQPKTCSICDGSLIPGDGQVCHC